MHQECRVAVHLFLERDGQILFARRANTGYEDGRLSVPAGHVDDDESPVAAMIREALEEVGLRLPAALLRMTHTMHRLTDVGPWVNFFFECPWQTGLGEPINAEPEKCSELLWAPRTDMPDDVVDYVRIAIERIAGGSDYSELDK